MFVDQVKVHARAGAGGNGVTSFARQAHEPRGGPDGGDGGNGGSVIVQAHSGMATLLDYHHRPHRSAERARHGQGSHRKGADGDDTVLTVPVGTVVRDDEGTVLADLVREGDAVVVARGGRGGRGNAAFATARRRAPGFHELGEPGEERWLTCELKLVCDVALVGFPNAGKSSLVSRLSAAKPKIAGYPFTTLAPNLGVVSSGNSGEGVEFVVADVPGLIEGASEGRGLGDAFLRHVERAGVLVHVLDCASYEQRDPREDLRVILSELRAYWPDLVERPALVWLNKVDADPEVAEIVAPDLEAEGWEVHAGSAVTGKGVDRLTTRLGELVEKVRAASPAAGPAGKTERPILRPPAAQHGEDFTVERVQDGFRVTGDKIERWVAMTDFDNEEGVGHLQSRLARVGVERALVEAGARRGDDVDIGGVVFAFEPATGELPSDESEPDGQAPHGGALEDEADEDLLQGDADEDVLEDGA